MTGAAGFIGSRLAHRLSAEGHRVVGIDAMRGTTTPAIAAERLAALADEPRFELLELDLLSPDVERVVTRLRPDVIFHLAARPGARDTHAAAVVRDCVDATARVVEVAAASDVPEIVFSSSSTVYGHGAARGACREDGPVAPMSVYGEAKRAAELLVLTAPTRSTVVRFFTVYGPGQRPDMAFARFIEAALGGDSAPLYQPSWAARDFTFVDDAVEGMLRARTYGTSPVYNISGGEVVTLGRARRMVEELTGATLTTHDEPAPPQPSTTRADLRLSRGQLGYAPRVGIRAGLTAQVAAAVASTSARVPGPTAVG